MRPRLILPLALGAAAALLFSCFPDYQIAGSGGGPGDGGTSADGTVNGDGGTSGADGANGGGDGSTTRDGGPIDGGDGASSPFDASGSVAIPGTGPGGYAYAAPNGTTSSTVVITHDFYLDATEATVARFTEWVNAAKPVPCATGQCSLDPGGPHESDMQWLSSWNINVGSEVYKDPSSCTRTDQSFSGVPTYTANIPNAPINCVNWYQAVAFCWWDGQKRLPTQVEWQWEASGRGRGRTYPWGDAPTPTDCTLAIWSSNATSGQGYNGCNFPKAVGSAPAGASFGGILDMAGSVYEWTWDENWNEYPQPLPDDYAGPPLDAGVGQRMSRGGGYTSTDSDLHTSAQSSWGAASTIADVGIRCARTKL